MGAILITAAAYAVYHLASIDEIHGLDAMLGEIAITFVIRAVLLSFVVWSRSVGVALIADGVMNYLVFLPMDHFHPPVWQWPVGIAVLAAVWLAYRWGMRRLADSRRSTTAFQATHPASPSVTAGHSTKNSRALASR